MKKRPVTGLIRTRSETSRTGHYCPLSGWWTAVGSSAGPKLIVEGEVMPALSGTAVVWILDVAPADKHSGAALPQAS
jgi:hypothetical protein